MTTNKELYRQKAPDLNLLHVFMQPWWLDAVCGEKNWDVSLVKEKDRIVAAWPYYVEQKPFVKVSRLPKFTQKIGVWLANTSEEKYNEHLVQLWNQMPHWNWFGQCFDFRFPDNLPAFSQFQKKYKHTYLLPDISDPEKVFFGFDRSKRRNINKALNNVEIRINALTAQAFYKHHYETLKMQGERIRYSFAEFEAIFKASIPAGNAYIVSAHDAQEHVHAVNMFLLDPFCAYNLISSIDPLYKNSGASALVVYEGIKKAAESVTQFDFCGSMIPGVAESNRRFGGRLKPYMEIAYINNPLIKMYVKLKNRN